MNRETRKSKYGQLKREVRRALLQAEKKGHTQDELDLLFPKFKPGTVRARVTDLIDEGWIRMASFKRHIQVPKRKDPTTFRIKKLSVYLAQPHFAKTFEHSAFTSDWDYIGELAWERERVNERVIQIREDQREIFRGMHRRLRRMLKRKEI